MNDIQFWEIITTLGATKLPEKRRFEQLRQRLMLLAPEELIPFQEHLYLRMTLSYRYDLWAVAYIINDGCSDDWFDYFRAWLISQGKEFFERALARPESVATRARADEDFFEALLYVAPEVYRSKTGLEFPDWMGVEGDPEGEAWEEDDLPDLYPELWKKARKGD